ncbi:MAG: hypothetical protein WDN06_00630 [Asticcacaulis sp.]
MAVAFVEPQQQLTGSKVYVLEFCDPARFVYDTTLQAYPYKYVHNDGSPHIEQIEIRIEGPAPRSTPRSSRSTGRRSTPP